MEELIKQYSAELERTSGRTVLWFEVKRTWVVMTISSVERRHYYSIMHKSELIQTIETLKQRPDKKG